MRVAPCSECSVDMRGAGLHGEAGDDLVEQHRHVRCRGNGGRSHGLSSPLFEPEAGDVLHVLGDALVREEQLRVPDLEGLAGAEEQGEVLDARPCARIIGGRTMRPELS